MFHTEEPSWIELKPKVEADWNACLQTLEGHGDSVTSVVFSKDGQRLASGSSDMTVKIWDATSGSCLQTLEVGHIVYHCSFDPLHNSRLLTDVGVVDLDASKSTSWPSFPATENPGFNGYGLGKDALWIMKDKKGCFGCLQNVGPYTQQSQGQALH